MERLDVIDRYRKFQIKIKISFHNQTVNPKAKKQIHNNLMAQYIDLLICSIMKNFLLLNYVPLTMEIQDG